jgi:hypothetical protein
MEHFKELIQIVSSEEGWCCQLGTTLDPKVKDKYAPFLLEPTPTLIEDVITTSSGKEYILIHQYDRIPEWKSILENKYK